MHRKDILSSHLGITINNIDRTIQMLERTYFTVLTGHAAIPQWLIHGHSPRGGIRGKKGFLFILIDIVYTIRHRKWFKRSKN